MTPLVLYTTLQPIFVGKIMVERSPSLIDSVLHKQAELQTAKW